MSLARAYSARVFESPEFAEALRVVDERLCAECLAPSGRSAPYCDAHRNRVARNKTLKALLDLAAAQRAAEAEGRRLAGGRTVLLALRADGWNPCAECGRVVPLDSCWKSGVRPNGAPQWSSLCAPCDRAAAFAARPVVLGPAGETFAERRAAGTLVTRLGALLSVQKDRARRHGVEIEEFTTRALLADWEGHGIDVGVCVYCGEPANSLDHIVPIKRQGAHSVANFVPACRGCNGSKNDKPLDLWFDTMLVPYLIARDTREETATAL